MQDEAEETKTPAVALWPAAGCGDQARGAEDDPKGARADLAPFFHGLVQRRAHRAQGAPRPGVKCALSQALFGRPAAAADAYDRNHPALAP